MPVEATFGALADPSRRGVIDPSGADVRVDRIDGDRRSLNEDLVGATHGSRQFAVLDDIGWTGLSKVGGFHVANLVIS